MKRNHFLPGAAVIAALVLPMASPAHADIIIIHDRAAFGAATTSSGTDDFEDLEPSQIEGALQRTAGVYRYRIAAGPSDAGFYPATFNGDTFLTSTLASDVLTFNGFGSDVYAFGGSFFATDAYGAYVPGRTIELSATSGADMATYILDGSAVSSFFGFVSTTPLTDITLRTIGEQGNVYWASVNNIVLAANDSVAPIPEPSSHAMLLTGLAAAAFARRARRSRA